MRAILLNPRYTGHQVWNKQRKKEVLVDVDDVSLGHHSRQTWNPADEWVWSDQPAHPGLIAIDTFRQAATMYHAPKRTTAVRKPNRSANT
ncbi:recombinase family protein [Salinifilum ghardaiensis]